MVIDGAKGVLEDERFNTPEARLEHTEPLAHMVQDALLNDDADSWMAKFAAVGINVGRVGVVEETLSDEQVHINKMVVPPVDESMGVPYIINHPLKADAVKQVGPRRAPEVGEHSAEVLAEIGYSQEAIEALRADGVI